MKCERGSAKGPMLSHPHPIGLADKNVHPPQHSVDPSRQIWDSPAVPQAKSQHAPTASEARAARRRAGWKLVVADSFAEAEAETRAYWRAATPAERLNALEILREPFYGKDQIGGRLQRFLEVVPAE